jgi:alkylation response protein AidB-like acyl-CoA dehydrogenase
LPLLDAVLVQEVLGEFAAPVEYTASAILAPLALTLAGSERQKEKWLPPLASRNTAGGGVDHRCRRQPRRWWRHRAE